MRCYICEEQASILYPVVMGKLEITVYVCKQCLTSFEDKHKGGKE